MTKLRQLLHRLVLERTTDFLSIYFDLGGDDKNIPVIHWVADEWLEDPETVVPAMLHAMELYYSNKILLLETLGFQLDIDVEVTKGYKLEDIDGVKHTFDTDEDFIEWVNCIQEDNEDLFILATTDQCINYIRNYCDDLRFI